MKRATSSVVSSANSDGASDVRISRSVMLVPFSTGSASRQSVVTTAVATGGVIVVRGARTSSSRR